MSLHHFDEGAAEHLIGQYVHERGDPANFDDWHASGRCHLASEDFVAFARSRGHAAHMIERYDTPGFRGEHIATVVHGMGVIDPTSAQLPHSKGGAYETVPYNEKDHHITGGWYGAHVPLDGRAAPAKLLKPKWPANKPWDDLPQKQQHLMTAPAPWIKWHA